jgi:hypothetical protein
MSKGDEQKCQEWMDWFHRLIFRDYYDNDDEQSLDEFKK